MSGMNVRAGGPRRGHFVKGRGSGVLLSGGARIRRTDRERDEKGKRSHSRLFGDGSLYFGVRGDFFGLAFV